MRKIGIVWFCFHLLAAAPAFSATNFDLAVLNEHFLNETDQSLIPEFTRKVADDLTAAARILGSLSPVRSVRVTLDFGGKLEDSMGNSERSHLILGSMHAIPPDKYPYYIAATVHELGHLSFGEFLYRPLLTEVSTPKAELYNFLDPYNELYADMLAVFFAESPTVLRDSIGDVDPREANSNQFPVRDFTANPPFEGWKHERSIISNGYMMLDPVRGRLWSISMERATRPTERELVLKAFLAATREHVLMRLKRGESDGHQLDAGQLNREFLAIYLRHAPSSIARLSDCERNLSSPRVRAEPTNR